ncbi:hypothetical protein M404DRAFT_555710 [Pisolithus tinctorius Marx 270]|uniref:Uncharacterized protein n=1 Tax=Pisolithus tinctorius Marx 270 TaxID=870435 RepID=A0A0C3P9F0_PISTI|nr:hypothetical protein M404DRAFT_555710 [Pisolithus tinctorius Marx 270]
MRTTAPLSRVLVEYGVCPIYFRPHGAEYTPVGGENAQSSVPWENREAATVRAQIKHSEQNERTRREFTTTTRREDAVQSKRGRLVRYVYLAVFLSLGGIPVQHIEVSLLAREREAGKSKESKEVCSPILFVPNTTKM